MVTSHLKIILSHFQRLTDYYSQGKTFVLRITLNTNTYYIGEMQFGLVVHIFTAVF